MDLPSKKILSLAAVKTMVAGAEAEAKKRDVEVTICVVDDSGNLLFIEKADGVPFNTLEFAQSKGRSRCGKERPYGSAGDAEFLSEPRRIADYC